MSRLRHLAVHYKERRRRQGLAAGDRAPENERHPAPTGVRPSVAQRPRGLRGRGRAILSFQAATRYSRRRRSLPTRPPPEFRLPSKLSVRSIRSCADKLDFGSWEPGGGKDVRRFGCRPELGKGSRLTRRGLFAIRNENGIHCQPHQGVDVYAPTEQAPNRQCNKAPILRNGVRTCLTFPSSRLGIGGEAKIADQRLGLSFYMFHSRAPAE